jgi:hypothetical protein
VAALSHYVARYEFKLSAWEEACLPIDRQEEVAVRNLKRLLTLHAQEPLVKMEALNNVTDLMDALHKRLGPDRDKSGVRAFTAVLNASGGLEKLGQIIAIDLFKGNADRFDWANVQGQQRSFGTNQGFNVRYMTRPNNVFLAVTDGRPEIAPLDFIDQTTGFKNIRQTLAHGEETEQWPGRILADQRRRKEFAEGVVHDLEAVLNPHKSKYSLRTKLSFGAAGRVESGMVQGALLIRTTLAAKYQHYPNGWPPGAQERYNVLCLVR